MAIRKPFVSAAPAAPARQNPQASRTQPAIRTPVPAQPATAVKAAKPAAPSKALKLRKKPVRDSFTMPEADFLLIATLKARALSAKRETKKSELLRAGLHALALLKAPALVAALGQLKPVKIGRPKADG